MKGCWHRLGSLCHEDAAGFEVAWVGEAVGGAPQHLEQVVGSFDSGVGGPVGVVPVEDLVGPGDDGVDCVVVLGQLAGLVEVAEPSEGLEGAVVVVGEVEAAVELLQCLPAGPQAGVGVEEGVEAHPVGVGEGVASAQQLEPGPEHFGVEGGLGAFRPALDVAADLGEARREPSDDMEAVQHMAGRAQVGVDGGLVGLADDDFDSLAPSVALLHQKR